MKSESPLKRSDTVPVKKSGDMTTLLYNDKDVTPSEVFKILGKQDWLFNLNQIKIDMNQFDNSVSIIEPCYIGNNVKLINCQIGPFVSIGNNTSMENCVISNTIIQDNSNLKNFKCENSMIGNHVVLNGDSLEYSIGDYSSQG